MIRRSYPHHCRLTGRLKGHEKKMVSCSTTQKNSMIDLYYGAYKALCLPFLGKLYHNSILLLYKTVCLRFTTVVKTVLDGREYQTARFICIYNSSDNQNELVDVVSSFITFCVHTTIPYKKKYLSKKIINPG